MAWTREEIAAQVRLVGKSKRIGVAPFEWQQIVQLCPTTLVEPLSAREWREAMLSTVEETVA